MFIWAGAPSLVLLNPRVMLCYVCQAEVFLSCSLVVFSKNFTLQDFTLCWVPSSWLPTGMESTGESAELSLGGTCNNLKSTLANCWWWKSAGVVQRGSFSGKFQGKCFCTPWAAALWCKSCYWEELSLWVGKHRAHALEWCGCHQLCSGWNICIFHWIWDVCWVEHKAGTVLSTLTMPVLESWCRNIHKEFSRVILLLISFPDVFHHFFPTNILCYIWKWYFSLLTASEYEKAGDGVASW